MKTVYRISSIVALCLILIASQLSASNENEKISKNLTSLLGSASEGTEFFLTFHPCWIMDVNPQNKILIYVSSAYKTKVTLGITAKSVYKEQECPANGVIVFELTPAEAQCYEKTDKDEPSTKFAYPGYGIIIRSEKPVVCYGLNTTQISSDGFLAIPKTSLGTNYIVSSYNSPTPEGNGQYLTSYTSIVGVYPDTEIEICIGGSKNNFTGKPSNLKTGSIIKINLQKGDVYLIGMKGDYNDLTGTTIAAKKPVSVISGSFGTNVTANLSYCNYLIEQDIPISAWGKQYHVIPIKDRKKAALVRVMASKPNTVIYLNGNEWATIETAGGEEGKGYFESRTQAEDATELAPVTITADNSIMVTQFNTGNFDDGVTSAPFQIALTPSEQYKNEVSWTIANNKGVPIYTKNYINICYQTDDLVKIPDDILFGQSDGTKIIWKKLSTLTTVGKLLMDTQLPEGQYRRATSMELSGPATVYYLKSNNPLSVYSYGVGDVGVYGYSTISNFKDISKLDISKPSLTYYVDCAGKINATISDEPVKNSVLRTNLKEVNLITDQSYNVTEIESNDLLISGVTYNWNFWLNVIDRNLKAQAVVSAVDCAGNDSTFTLEYSPIKFTMDQPFYSFGANSIDGPTKTITCKLTNNNKIPLVLDSIYLKSKYKKSNLKFAGFTIDSKIYKENGGTLPELTLNAGAEISFDVTFAPTSVKDDFIGGKNEFIDSIGIKAYWTDDVNECLYTKYLAQVTGNVQFLDTLAPSVTYKPCCCGNTASGTVTDEPANDPANRSNLASIALDNYKSINCTKVKYDETAFVPGTTSSIDWEVGKLDIDKDGKAVIVFTDRAGNETEVTIDLIKIKVSTQDKIVDYGLKNLDDLAESRTVKFKNESSKPIVVDSLTLLSADKNRDWPFSGFMIDPAIYESNGGILPGYTLPIGGELTFNVIFLAQSVQSDIYGGKLEFQDSIGIKANWNAELNQYCFNEYKTQVIAKVKPVSVEDETQAFGIMDISPNPANSSSTNIHYNLENDCNVVLQLYNSNGILISNLMNEYKIAGSQTFTIALDDLPAGMYFIEFKAGALVGHKSFIVVK
ncbi:MAG: T9SS type A sorting domain-containing protein [bacterium]